MTGKLPGDSGARPALWAVGLVCIGSQLGRLLTMQLVGLPPPKVGGLWSASTTNHSVLVIGQLHCKKPLGELTGVTSQK